MLLINKPKIKQVKINKEANLWQQKVLLLKVHKLIAQILNKSMIISYLKHFKVVTQILVIKKDHV